jgi:hypothetical protein
VNATSNVVVYTNGATKVLSKQVPAGQLTRFTVHSKHGTKTWDLYVDGELVDSELPFYNTGTGDDYSKLSILYGDATTPAVVDDINVDTVDPTFATTTTVTPTTTTVTPTTTTVTPTTTTVAPTTTTTTTALVITNVELTAGMNYRIEWNSESGLTYRVWWNDDLLLPWELDQTETVIGGEWTDTNSIPTARFYRLSID